MSTGPTTRDLVKAQAVTEEDLQSALDAFKANPDTEVVDLGASYRLNLQAALKASSFAQLTLAKPGANDLLKRAAVRTAILLARPKKR